MAYVQGFCVVKLVLLSSSTYFREIEP